MEVSNNMHDYATLEQDLELHAIDRENDIINYIENGGEIPEILNHRQAKRILTSIAGTALLKTVKPLKRYQEINQRTSGNNTPLIPNDRHNNASIDTRHTPDKKLDLKFTDYAACAGEETRTFYPFKDEKLLMIAAKAICARCLVRDECLNFAIENEENYGIWGGLTPKERLNKKNDVKANKDMLI